MAVRQISVGVSIRRGMALARRVEWVTVGLIAATYAVWAGLLASFSWLPWPVLGLLGGAVVCLHGSLQHEIIHGHPTPWSRLNYALVSVPLSLWLPFEIYRRSHIAHHATEALTCPKQDPESAYVDAAQWRTLPKALQWLLMANQTLLGRLIIGPVIICSRFWWRSLSNIWLDINGERGIWLRHIVIVAAQLWLIAAYFKVPPLLYIVLFAWPGISLTLVRSFAEHHPAVNEDDATAVVQSKGPLAFLFLYNNYHWWHHRYPRTPWYRLARLAEQRASDLPQGVPVYTGYGHILRIYGWRCRDIPWRVFKPAS